IMELLLDGCLRESQLQDQHCLTYLLFPDNSNIDPAKGLSSFCHFILSKVDKMLTLERMINFCGVCVSSARYSLSNP
ncbi:hypothetical protein, partial [Nostoc sp.]|uniref:hypothetical protein n=1 Tax=Nostoc sp. TaxID=1180 RepID=UPI002FF5D1ED